MEFHLDDRVAIKNDETRIICVITGQTNIYYRVQDCYGKAYNVTEKQLDKTTKEEASWFNNAVKMLAKEFKSGDIVQVYDGDYFKVMHRRGNILFCYRYNNEYKCEDDSWVWTVDITDIEKVAEQKSEPFKEKANEISFLDIMKAVMTKEEIHSYYKGRFLYFLVKALKGSTSARKEADKYLALCRKYK